MISNFVFVSGGLNSASLFYYPPLGIFLVASTGIRLIIWLWISIIPVQVCCNHWAAGGVNLNGFSGHTNATMVASLVGRRKHHRGKGITAKYLPEIRLQIATWTAALAGLGFGMTASPALQCGLATSALSCGCITGVHRSRC